MPALKVPALGGTRPSCFLSLLAAAVLSACHHSPPTIVPPPPSAAKVLQLQRTIDTLLADPAAIHGIWGVVVRSLARDDDTVYAANGRTLLMPASTMKVLTLATAADQLGWDFKYRTRVFTTGTVENGVLSGDVVIEGSGDPTLDDWDGVASGIFDRWAELLKQAGIHTIAGRIVGDDNAFDDEGVGAGWAWDDLGASYATSVGALQFNENTAQLIVTPGSTTGERPTVDVSPPAAGLSVRNLATTTAAGTATSLVVRTVPRAPTLELRGAVPIGAARIVHNVSVPNPTLYYANAVRDALVRNGLEVVGRAVDIDDLDDPPSRDKATFVTDVFSPPLPDLAATMMRLSQNLFAESLLRTVGARTSGVGSAEAGRDAVKGNLVGWGVPAGDLLMVDGSGLSRYNLITPDALVAVLAHIYKDDRLRDTFIGTLPLAGVNGTLADRMKGTTAAGNARAKTGSLSNARSIAGYVRTADGEPLAFAVIANNYGVVESRVIDNISDAIIVALAMFSRR